MKKASKIKNIVIFGILVSFLIVLHIQKLTLSEIWKINDIWIFSYFILNFPPYLETKFF